MESHAPVETGFTKGSLSARLVSVCTELLTAKALCVAFSGGLDSTVLLHLLKTLRDSGQLVAPLRAVHVNHGLQASAGQWQQHCLSMAQRWQLDLVIKQVDATPAAGESVEAAARRARYQAFEEVLQAEELLLQAHHADDQAETLLLRLLRGSGSEGMAAMPAARPLGRGHLLRPLLEFTRDELEHYASLQQLQWVVDPSNSDQRFDRNFLRASVMPVLEQRWPNAKPAMARSAGLLRESAQLLNELASQDLLLALGAERNRLRLCVLSGWSEERQRNLLRYWLQQQHTALAVEHPGFELLARIQQELVTAANDHYVHLQWGRADHQRELHSYRGELVLLRPLPQELSEQTWVLKQVLDLPAPLGTLHWYGSALCDQLQVRFRAGGERIRKRDGHHQSFKDYCQEQGIPPWLRHAMPLLYRDSELIAVGEQVLNGTSLSSQTENHSLLRWQRSHLLCGW